MTSKNERSNLSNICIPESELRVLYGLMTAVFGDLRHDTANSLYTIGSSYELLSFQMDELEEILARNQSSDATNDIIRKIRNYCQTFERSCKRLYSLIDVYLEPFSRNNSVDPFIAKPFEIIKKIEKERDEIEIAITRRSLKSLEILYPSVILFGILWELTNNAIQHSGVPCQVLVNWRVIGSKFECEVHDNGVGIVPASYRGFASPDLLPSLSDSEFRKGGGILMLTKVLHSSRGKLLFARSRILGGTLVHFDFPVFAHYKQGARV